MKWVDLIGLNPLSFGINRRIFPLQRCNFIAITLFLLCLATEKMSENFPGKFV